MGKCEDMHISETTNAKCGFVVTRFLPLFYLNISHSHDQG